ncbi:COBRA-like protein 1, partial [Cucurbita argyrosperma subsp. sororia]
MPGGCQSNLNDPQKLCGAKNSPHLASVVTAASSRSSKNNVAPLFSVPATCARSEFTGICPNPNFDNLTQIFSFNYKSINPYGTINDTAILWGVKFYNDLLMQAGPAWQRADGVTFPEGSIDFHIR